MIERADFLTISIYEKFSMVSADLLLQTPAHWIKHRQISPQETQNMFRVPLRDTFS